MFARRVSVNRIDAAGARHACPIGQIDNFAMRNFTNDAIFDDTFPVSDGILEQELACRSIGSKAQWKIGSAAKAT